MFSSDKNVQDSCIYVAQSRPVNNLEKDVRCGLLARPRCLPPKYFYDETGSRLFDQICDTEEYYPTRTEAALLRQFSAELIDASSPQHILEFGSGSSRKTRHLLSACERLGVACEYLPFDVCEEMLLQVSQEFNQDYSWLDVKLLIGDYTAGLDYLHQPSGTCMYVFLGSSIGNFSVAEARAFIKEIRRCMKPGDSLLLGVDRIKDHDVLHAAYNDAAGITQEFNLNMLQVLNEKLQANFDQRKFRHEASYNSVDQRIEMYLVSEECHTVHLKSMDEQIHFLEEEKILTEISHKYSKQGVEDLLTDSGLHILKHIEAENAYFSLVLGRL
ncbi:MAG: L-histidine N(alpha)-methyltransferase [Gammaproteobacteria bacterium]|nr:L-histidine N(alpha)-methyltransferase [Gammaproteobacteria bacterium]